MFQSTSACVALLSTIGLVLYQIELRDNILEYQIVIVVPVVTKIGKSKLRVDMYGIISGHSTAKVIFKWFPCCLSAYEFNISDND